MFTRSDKKNKPNVSRENKRRVNSVNGSKQSRNTKRKQKNDTNRLITKKGISHFYFVFRFFDSALVKGLFVAALSLSLLGSAGYVVFNALNKPVKSVTLKANLERVTALEIEAVMSGFKKVGFLELNLDDIQKELEDLSWVDRAEVQRLWPNRLMLTLQEQVAVARWNDQGLLNSRGELILQKSQLSLPPELPNLIGPENSEWRVAQRYLELYNLVRNYGLFIKTLELDKRGSWQFTLSNEMKVKLGKHQTDKRLQRFVKEVLPKIQSQYFVNNLQSVKTFDMRYSNGFSVDWHDLNLNELNSSARAEL